MTPFQKVAIIGLIDTPETVAAIKALDISDIHKSKLCDCLTSIQWWIKEGKSPSEVMSWGYEKIHDGMKPSDTALTEAERETVLDAIVTSVLIGVDALKAEVIASAMPVQDGE